MGKTKNAKLRDSIKKDLLDQLERNATVGKYYVDLVDDYMAMWDTKNLLIADINARGVTVPALTGGTKKNDSTTDLVRVNGQMIKLLAEIGIKPEQPAQSDGDGCEL